MVDSFLNGEYIYATFLILLLIGVPFFFYLQMQSSILKLASPSSRKMPPGEVWLALIPLFGNIWHFKIVDAVSSALKNEFSKRQVHLPESNPGYTTGLVACFLKTAFVIPSLGTILFIIGTVVWAVYWIKISQYKKKLELIIRSQAAEKMIKN